jgi:hypothetical protein
VDIAPRPLIGETKLHELLMNFLIERSSLLLDHHAINLEFIVYKNGEISNVQVTGNDLKTDEKIMKSLKTFHMKWIPGIYKTDVVNVRVSMDVVFN